LASLFAKKFWRGGEPRFARFAGVFEGCFGKSALQRAVFCGEVVVNCVVNVDRKTFVFGDEK
jgi:hypothetical protein